MEGRAIARPNARVPEPATAAGRHLQWRAGQLPGQTRRLVFPSQRQQMPSMEGRAIARPNHPMTGGRAVEKCLQWRAGQLPGQTCRRRCRPERRRAAFNGGPGNCPAKRGPQPRRRHHRTDPSMEGRAIARPNRSLDLGSLTCPFSGVCERSRKRELRRCLDSVFKLRFALCHKASSGPRNLRAHRSARIR